MKINIYYDMILLMRLVYCFDIDDPPLSSTEPAYLFSNGQYARFNNQTDDILSTIYSTVASVSKELNTAKYNNTYSTSGIPNKQDDEFLQCRGSNNEEEFTIRPNHRVCDYVVNRNHSGICSLDLILIDWNGECRENWLEVGGKLDCGTLTGNRRINFDRSSISLRMRSADGIVIVKQIPCSSQVTHPTALLQDSLYQPKPGQYQFPEPYFPPNLRPTTPTPDPNRQTIPLESYRPTSESYLHNHENSLDNEISSNKIDNTALIQIPNSNYPVIPQQNKGHFPMIYRPNNPQSLYPGMRYGPPECDRNTGVVVSSPGYPNRNPSSECILVLYPSIRLCSPYIYFDFFDFGMPYSSTCQESRVEIGGIPFCGCLSGMSWQVPNNVFSPDGSLIIRLKGQGRFLLTIYYNTCQPGYNPYPPNQRQQWRCNQFPPSLPSPQPYPVNPYPPTRPPRPYPAEPPYPIPTPQPPYPIPTPQPPYPIPTPQPLYPIPTPQPPRPNPTFPEPSYPYPPRQPRPQPPFVYPPRPQPPVYPPQTFPPPIPLPQPQPYPEPIPQPYPPCQVIRVPSGSINCAPMQPKFYCYRFEPPEGYCQMVIRIDEVSMASDRNCNSEYLSTGIRDPRICQRDIPMYVDRGGYLQGKLMPGSSVKASFQGLPCSCNEEYRQNDFTLRGSPSQNNCEYTIHRSNEGVCSLEMTFDNIDLECGSESLLIDGKSYCGLRANEKLEVPFVEPSMIILYQRNGQPSKTGSFSINVSQKNRCIQTFSSATGRDIKFGEDCTQPLTGVYGNIEFPASSINPELFPTCTYIIQPKKGYCYVRIDFDEVDIPNTLDCRRYYIEINGIKYCGNTLTSSTKVLELNSRSGSALTYRVNRYSRWKFTYSLLPCRQEILSRAQNTYSTEYYQKTYILKYMLNKMFIILSLCN